MIFFFLVAQATLDPFPHQPSIATPLPMPPRAVTAMPRPVFYVSVRGDSRTKIYLAPTWDPSRPPSKLPCPKRGDKTWSETISFPSIVVRFDCPVGVAYKTWEPSGRRVHVGIKSTTTLHPGALPADGSVTYELVAPE